MRDALEARYEDELAYIRQLGSEFAKSRPKIADRLFLDKDSGVADDPHVERLIEAFAFLTARIRLKLDDEFPELTESLLSVLYPHYLAPIPSMSIVQFVLDPDQGRLTAGHFIPRDSRLYSREVRGIPCRFRTCYPVTLWPIEIQSVRYVTAPFSDGISPPARSVDSPALLRIQFRAQSGIQFSEFSLDQLRFFISGDDQAARHLYDLIFHHVTDILLRPGEESFGTPPVLLSPGNIHPVGFASEEGLLPYGHQSHIGYRLLTEYFVFPSKFQFFDLTGLEGQVASFHGDTLEILLFLDRHVPGLETRVKNESLRLGCAPIINLFEQTADPIHVSHTRFEYHVTPDARFLDGFEVYSVDAVQSTNLDTQETTTYHPFYSFQHARDVDEAQAYWYAKRRPSVRKGDEGSEVYLSLVDLHFHATKPPADVLMLQTTCTNRNLPAELRAAGGEAWGFQLEGQAPLRRITPVINPTVPVRFPVEEGRWRLISHLSLNHLSITDREDGAEALREILRLYDFTGAKTIAQQIAGILSVSSRRAVAPVNDPHAGRGFCRGVEITVEFDEEKYTGTSVLLFAAVLERFFGLYTTINSATRMVARSKQKDAILKRWPFRAGDRTLL